MKTTLQKHLGNQKPLDKNLFDILMEKQFTMKDLLELNTGITYRTINHWAEKGYLLSESKEGDWRKFSFAEYIWILFLNEIREMEVSFKNILPSLFIGMGIPEKEYYEMDELQFEKLKQLPFEKLTKKVNPEVVLENFCWTLVTIISYKTPITIRFFKGGNYFFVYGNPVYHGLTIKTFLDEYKNKAERSNFVSSISVSIDALIKDFIDKKTLDNISTLKILTDQEIEILNQIRDGQLKEITIFLEDGKPDRIQLVDEENNADIAKRIKEDFFSDYQSCQYITNGGKSHTLKRITSKKLS